MLSYLAQTESYFGGVQRGTENPSQAEKEDYMHSILHQSAGTFLARYGERMTDAHTSYFKTNLSGR